LCLDQQGHLEYFVPVYTDVVEGIPVKPPRFVGYKPIPLPDVFKEQQSVFEPQLAQLLAKKNEGEWMWGIGATGILAAAHLRGNGYRWHECEICHRLRILLADQANNATRAACLCDNRIERDNGHVIPQGSYTDQSPRLIHAYVAARQARFEYGEQRYARF